MTAPTGIKAVRTEHCLAVTLSRKAWARMVEIAGDAGRDLFVATLFDIRNIRGEDRRHASLVGSGSVVIDMRERTMERGFWLRLTLADGTRDELFPLFEQAHAQRLPVAIDVQDDV